VIQHWPRVTNTLAGTSFAFGADYVQQRAEGHQKLDWTRSFAFVGFVAVISQAGYVVYVKTFPRLFPAATTFASHPTLRARIADRPGQRSLAQQIALDLFGWTPFCYLPVFYTFKAAFQGGIYEPVQAAVQGLHLYRANFVTDNAMSLMLWIPGDILCFTVPLHMRMPLSHALNFVFLSGLSALRGAQTIVVPTVNPA